jgi:hypothetical protein
MSGPPPVWVNDREHARDVARFVIEGDPYVNHLVAGAADELRILTHYEHWSFASAVADGGREALAAAVEALYLHLMADHQLFYEFELAYDVATGEQRVQLPAVTVRERKGTCIDLALLFLSALAQAKLAPVYVQLNRPGGGHALAAAGLAPPAKPKELLTLEEVRDHLKEDRLLVVECTGFVQGTPGRQHRVPFREARELVEGPSWAGWAVDVHRTWEGKEVTPLPPCAPPEQPWAGRAAGGPDPNALRAAVRPFAAYIREKTRDFVGREWAFRAIDRLLGDRARFPSGYVLITGEPGIGKSALAARLVQERGYVHHFNIAVEGVRSWREFATNVCAQLIVRYQLPRNWVPNDKSTNPVTLKELLQEAADRRKGEPLMVVIDALDEAEREEGANPLSLPFALPDGVYVVATTRPGDEYRPSVSSMEELALDGTSEDNRRDVRAHVAARLPRPGIRAWLRARSLGSEQFTELLCDRSQGNFMYLHFVLRAIEAGEFQEEGPEALPRGLRDYYRRHWEKMRRRGRRRFDQVYRPVVCVLAAAREAVSEEQVAEWTGLEEGQVHQVVQDWREFLHQERGEGRRPLYRVYHASFRDYLQEEVDPGLKTYHALIARSALRKVRGRKEGRA